MNSLQPVSRNALCPCGSGKKYKRCCAVATARAEAAAPSARTLLQHALRLQQQGDLRGALRSCETAAARWPKLAEAHYLLGFLQSELGDAEAAANMQRALGLGLRDAAAHFHYGLVLARLQRSEEAAAQFQRALVLRPDFREARNNLANLHFDSGELDEAERLYLASLQQEPNDFTARHNLAHVYYQREDLAKAIEQLTITTRIAPDYGDAFASLALLYEADNQIAAAHNALQRALAVHAGHPSALVTRAKLLRREGKLVEAQQVLESVEVGPNHQRVHVTLLHEIGTVLDAQGDYRGAMAAFAQSKQALASLTDDAYQHEIVEQRLQAAEDYFAAEEGRDLLELADRGPAAAIAPVFVLGFNRAGTTLVEQILGAHPQIAAAGELSFVRQAEDALFGADGLSIAVRARQLVATADDHPIAEQRTAYLDKVNALGLDLTGKRWVTDKMPLNSLRLHVIRLLFPGAAIVHVTRHPLDVVLSNFFQVYLQGSEWSYRMSDIARLLVRTREHVARMAQSLGLHLYTVRYERLVAEIEPNVRALLDFIGAPWHEGCVSFHQSRRVARTASYEQVTRKLYDSSVYRYKNYLEFIDDETLCTLEPLVRAEGYEL